MTALGLLVIAAGISLIWAGITGKDALGEIRAALQGRKALPVK